MTEPLKIWGAPEGWDAFLLAQRRREYSGPIVHVTRDDSRMARLAEALAFTMPEAEVLRFPAWDCLPYDRVSPNPVLVSERIATLARLLDSPQRPRIVLTTVNALVQRVPPRATFAGASFDLSVNGMVQPEKLAAFLEANGYGRPKHFDRHKCLPIEQGDDARENDSADFDPSLARHERAQARRVRRAESRVDCLAHFISRPAQGMRPSSIPWVWRPMGQSRTWRKASRCLRPQAPAGRAPAFRDRFSSSAGFPNRRRSSSA